MKRYLIALLVILFGGRSAAVAALPTIRLEPISQQQIVAPVGITHAGDGSNRLFVTDQRGTIHVVENGNVLPTPLLDIESRLVPERPGFDERGLLGMAFHPHFGQVGETGADKFYVYYSAPQPGGDPNDPVQPVNHQSIIAEYSVTGIGSNVANPDSERILLTFDQPQFNHDAGFLGFGPDNLLYVTTGDGGGADDNDAGHTGGDAGKPSAGLGNAQDLTQLLGKVLRIDVDGNNGPGGQYGIPGDNPFVGEGGGVHEEIFAYGLRNPWRASFDNGPGGSGRLFVADVGQGDVEEVNLIESGGNYGWRIREGTFDFDPSVSPTPIVPLIDPIAEYAHPGSANGLLEVGLAVTGGVVYRGSDFPELQGAYLFADWSNGFSQPNGTLLGLEETTPGIFNLSPLEVVGGNPIGQFIQAFGLDESGEAYVATKGTLAPSVLDSVTGLPTGAIYRITVVPEPATSFLCLFSLLVMANLHARYSPWARVI
ncbi:MAG: PQQ-dependent sugar dehydrogenase [Pirellulaceae bacterium]